MTIHEQRVYRDRSKPFEALSNQRAVAQYLLN